eukprot:GHVU01068746.1.p2 GENE.GHVU01068746.1~~GHVU01068746.1.p2  ORF type:complete len:113 (-),score=10.46 GHVU01068746.1:290-628(-)
MRVSSAMMRRGLLLPLLLLLLRGSSFVSDPERDGSSRGTFRSALSSSRRPATCSSGRSLMVRFRGGGSALGPRPSPPVVVAATMDWGDEKEDARDDVESETKRRAFGRLPSL